MSNYSIFLFFEGGVEEGREIVAISLGFHLDLIAKEWSFECGGLVPKAHSKYGNNFITSGISETLN